MPGFSCRVTLVLGLAAGSPYCLGASPWIKIADGPEGWRAEAPRAEIAPRFGVLRDNTVCAGYGLSISPEKNEAAQGAWIKSFLITPGQWYRFAAKFRASSSGPLFRRSILARVIFLDASGKMIGQAEYPATNLEAEPYGWKTVTADYLPDAKARSARVELWLQWTTVSVVWGSISLRPTADPGKRVVKIAAVHFLPQRQTKGPDQNRELYAQMIEKAAAQKPDVILLGEGITVVNTGKSYVDVAEAVPGPTTRRLGELSKKHACYIAAGIYERAGKLVYNTAVLMGPDGDVTGTYRKVCLPREEIEGGITPGSEYPVFQTRFGKIGMMVCWDIHFPEVARRLAINGAEIILVPIWGGNELLLRARAVENQVYVASSSYYDKLRTAVWDRRGDAVAATNQWGQIAVAEVDLNARTYWDWLGDFKARIPRERPLLMPE
jgi:predicted amidohydrolase